MSDQADRAPEDRRESAGGSWPSLLWPGGKQPFHPPLTGGGVDWSADLDLESLVRELSLDPAHREFVSGILRQLCGDAEVIRYRQDILEDFLRSSSLRTGLTALLPVISGARRFHAPREKGELLFEVAWRLGELQTYVECIEGMRAVLEESAPEARSAGIARLRDRVRETAAEDVFLGLRRELPDLLSKIRGVSSVTIGVNLDQDLQPSEAALLSVNEARFTGSSSTLLRKLFGKAGGSGPAAGIAPLHRAPPGAPTLAPLFRDLSDVLTRICRPVVEALKRYVSLKSEFLEGIGRELVFYLGAAQLTLRMQSRGLPFCKPGLAAAEDRACRLKDTWCLSLGLRFSAEGGPADLAQRVVGNDCLFDREARIFILTGPNRGGKTTYLQAVGQAHVLAQAGLFVPGKEALLSPVDAIFTHFPREERPETDAGRLGEEAKRLTSIFQRATPASLVLLNESLSNTSPRESFQLALDVVRALQVLGARAIYTTHLHELATEAIRAGDGKAAEPGIASLVSLTEVEPGGPGESSRIRRTFRIVRRAPTGSSHAREIALLYGISYEQLVETMRRRGIIP